MSRPKDIRLRRNSGGGWLATTAPHLPDRIGVIGETPAIACQLLREAIIRRKEILHDLAGEPAPEKETTR